MGSLRPSVQDLRQGTGANRSDRGSDGSARDHNVEERSPRKANSTKWSL